MTKVVHIATCTRIIIVKSYFRIEPSGSDVSNHTFKAMARCINRYKQHTFW